MGIQKITQIFVGSHMIYRTHYLIITILLLPCCPVLTLQASPVVPNLPFIMGWNAPTEMCVKKFKVTLDLSLFSFTGSTLKSVTNQTITIFYTDRLGYYPYFDEKTGNAFNEGLPQLASLKKHLEKAKTDIVHYIPSKDTFGLTIIDWENWRPIWIRNWKPKNIYQIRSIELIHQQNIKLNGTKVFKAAQKDFEKSAKSFMQETLKLGKSLRPNHLWGYYLFPDCYNNKFKSPDYNGNCVSIEKARNNKLDWLWNESTALFPSIYLPKKLKISHKIQLYVRNRIQEAIRISQVIPFKNPLPIFAYARPVFSDVTSQYLSEDDLVYTIGESVSLGVSGIIMWGSLNFTRSKKTCTDLDNYIRTTLNPYIVNVTLAAKMCSQAICQEQGACIRKVWNSSDYLHLNPKRFTIQAHKTKKYVVNGKPTLQDLQEFSKNFYCNCYTGSSCKTNVNVENVRHIRVCILENICIEAYLDSKVGSYISGSPSKTQIVSALSHPAGIEDDHVSSTVFDGYDIGYSSNNGHDNSENVIIKCNPRMKCSAEGTHAAIENAILNSFQAIPGLSKPDDKLLNNIIYSRTCSVFMNIYTQMPFIFITVQLFLLSFVFVG